MSTAAKKRFIRQTRRTISLLYNTGEIEFTSSRLCASIFLNLDTEKQSDFIIRVLEKENELTELKNKRRKIG
nr:hypothetical protein [Tanacetum cinerariifolium]